MIVNKLRRVVVWLALAASSVCAAEAPLPPLPAALSAGPMPVSFPSTLGALPRPKNGAFDLRFVNVGQVVDLVYGEALKVPHVISDDVLQDKRLVSFQFDTGKGDLRAFMKVFLDSLGFQVETKGGVDFVGRRADAVPDAPKRATLVYRPKFRSAAYLASLVQPLFGSRLGASMGAPVTPQAAAVPVSASSPVGSMGVGGAALMMPAAAGDLPLSVSASDELVFSGSASDIAELRKLLPQVDRAAGEVVVRGWVYEVSNTDQNNSAFSIAAKVLGGAFSASNGSTDDDPTSLRFAGGWLNFAISALNADTRFKQVSDPHVRVVSGGKVRLNVGSQVPTLGSISYQGASGTPVQSVEYQDAGLIFDVQPTVMADAIQVTLNEEMSSFVATRTGVNNSPTKNTRQMSTTVNMRDGEFIVLGGLVQDGDTSTINSPGWLPKFLDGHASSKSRTEVLLVLQVSKVNGGV